MKLVYLVIFFLVLLVSSCKKEVVSKTTSTPTQTNNISNTINSENQTVKDTVRIYQLEWGYSINPDTLLKGKLNQGKSVPNTEFYIDFQYFGDGLIIPEKNVECITIPGISLKYIKIDTISSKSQGKIYYSLSGTPSKSGLAKFKIKINNKNGNSIYDKSVYSKTNADTISLRVNGFSEPINDIDGNSYKTVWIGKQLWMAENLKTTKYNDGSSIPLNENGSSSYSVYPGYCYYNNDANNKNLYGVLYQWGVVEKQKVCPTGWRVPSDYDYYTLTGYLGNDDFLAEKLKDTLTWKQSSYYKATNSSLFSALAAGPRASGFSDLGGYTGFWTSSLGKIYGDTNPMAFLMRYNAGYFTGSLGSPNEYFFYIRCLKN